MIDRIALWTLLHNLAVGAALCEAYAGGRYAWRWRPNVEGKEMPR